MWNDRASEEDARVVVLCVGFADVRKDLRRLVESVVVYKLDEVLVVPVFPRADLLPFGIFALFYFASFVSHGVESVSDCCVGGEDVESLGDVFLVDHFADMCALVLRVGREARRQECNQGGDQSCELAVEEGSHVCSVVDSIKV